MTTMMRHVLLLLALLSPGILTAQDVNGSFESWENRDGREQPNGWTTSYFGSSRSNPGRDGSCVAVWNWYSYARGIAALGATAEAGPVLESGGMPISTPPARVSGYYRYIPGSNSDRADSAVVLVGLKRWNGSLDRTEVVASVELHLPPTSEWTSFEAVIPDPTATPDSLAIAFISSVNGFCGPDSSNCCYFYIDDVALTGASGVPTSIDDLLHTSRVIPNPTNGSSCIEFDPEPDTEYSLTITDVNGRPLVDRRRVDARIELSRYALPTGAYRYMIVGRRHGSMEVSSGIVRSGGFIVP